MAEIKLFNQNWTFLKIAPGTELSDITRNREGFVPVDIPHDWLIYQAKDLYENSTGWYRKAVTVKELGLSEGQRAILRFDGVYMDSTLYVNGQKVGDWKYGYSAFQFDITDYLSEEENELLLQVRFLSPNSRWYSGAGIYRNVWLKVYPTVYLPLDGTYVSTEYLEDGRYQLDIETECGGALSEAVKCHYSLYFQGQLYQDLGWQDEAVQKQQTKENSVQDSQYDTDASQAIESPAQNGQSGIDAAMSMGKTETLTIACIRREIHAPKEWSLEEPNCYKLLVELYDGETVVDSQEITIGFRRMEFDPATGFYLNGKHVKVNGVCEHHDFGCLGAVFHKEAMRRKFEILRTMGVNALRTSHNMPATELMELADEMGFLIMDEAFDMWERSKTNYDYGRFFKEWAESDVCSWIRRDRNHPSLFMWSIGNEIYDTHADEHGQEITRRLIGYVREHDPKENAVITIGSNFMPWENAQKCADIVKYAGYNYGEKYYEKHHEEHPDWVIYGSETASLVQSRGVYRFPLKQSMLADEDEQCSALGNSSTSWGARSVETCISKDRDMEFSFGQFLWTGFDYIGEPTPYHTKNSYFGQIDTAGFPKDSFYVFQAEWTDSKKAPMVHIYPYWDFNEGQTIDVRACTNGCSVELFINGASKGRQYIDHKHGEVLQGTWQVAYEPGEIMAVAYDEAGVEIARETRHSFGDGVKLTLETKKQVLRGDGEDLSFITIGVVDKDGYPVENAMNYVEILVNGAGRLLGLDNGDSSDFDEYKGNVRKLFNGKLLAVVASKPQAGEITVTVNGKGLESASLQLQATEADVRAGICATEDLMKQPMQLTDEQPVRRIEIRAQGDKVLTAENNTVLLEARVLPADATDREILWKVVNDNGIDIPYARIEVLSQEAGVQKARLTAIGDGDFQVRCLSKSGSDKIKLISQLDFKAVGMGQAFVSPYEFVSAGLFNRTIGEISNGNEKGIATARDGISGAVYEKIDFGEYGSDEVTIPVFALDSELHNIELWQGTPGEEGSELLHILKYQKPSQWNVYQEDTWQLPRRIKGVVTLAIQLHEKVHIKGFSFKKYEKAFSPLYAAECNKVYGDTFTVEEQTITGIGNNVTLVFENMDFGEAGAVGIELTGRSKLAGNTIHILFTPEDGELQRRVLEVKGTAEYEAQTFTFEPITGKGKIEFVFLPGSDFDMESFVFINH